MMIECFRHTNAQLRASMTRLEGGMNELFSPPLVAESDTIAANLTTHCEQCGKPFEPRSGSGGKPQRFCSPECRAAFHTKPQCAQRSPTCSNVAQLPAVIQPAEKDAPADSSDDFDWSGEDVIIHEQPATAVYWNAAGSLTIRQQCWPDENSINIISHQCRNDVLDRLTDRCGIPSVGGPKS